MTDYDKGYIDGLEFALKKIQFKPELGAYTTSDVELKIIHCMLEIQKEINKVKENR